MIKRTLIVLLTVLIVVISGVFIVISITNEETQGEEDNYTVNTKNASDDEEVNINSTVNHKINNENDNTLTDDVNNEEVVDIPNTRTVDIGGNYPWQYFTKEKIQELQSNGERIFIYNDAEALEQFIIMMANEDIPDYAPTTKEVVIQDTIGYISSFINDVQPYIDNQAYFDKLNEIKVVLQSGDYEQVASLVNDASALR